jgi:hypothetical protein
LTHLVSDALDNDSNGVIDVSLAVQRGSFPEELDA